MPDLKRSFESKAEIKVHIDGIELTEIKKYANMFINYKSVSVWSSPEVLAKPGKVQDPTPAMDVYSFGFLMWEIFFNLVPFDGDVQ